ncbi:MAG: diaminopimelate epimerase [Ruminococcus sp.]|jgi:diaminopimelate epimerase|nr:diaminopimelate epimerase [Ruminococcus sp.]
MEFTKMHGLGNDFIITTADFVPENPEKKAKTLCDRRFGIGADGLVFLLPSDKADFCMRLFNSDGSEADMCGNATRCIGKFVYEKGLVSSDKISLETNSGIKYITVFHEGEFVTEVEVEMGSAVLDPKLIPIVTDKEIFLNEPVEIGGEIYFGTGVSMGNPHLVVFVDDVNEVDIDYLGPLFENNKIFPNRVNTEFVQVIDGEQPNEHSGGHLKMRVYERGCGETTACGTGACASVAASVLRGFCKRNSAVKVELTGGELYIVYRDDGTVTMRGAATEVFTGTVGD